MGRVTAIVASVVLLVIAVAAVRSAQVRFPRDHFGHPAASIEWWYFTALVHDPAGTRYSVFFTLFSSRGALVPVAQVRNLDTGALVGHSEQLALGHVSGSSLNVHAGPARLHYEPASNRWLFAVDASSLQLALNQKPEKRYALHGGGTAVIHQSVAGTSHYYSDTRMRATGSMILGGKRVQLNGESWFDHQWGNYRDDPRAFNWDWFSCRFSDDSELMLYQFRDRQTGQPLTRYRNGTFVRPNGDTVEVTGFTAQHGRRALTAAGHQWPLDWQVDVPALHLHEKLRSLLPNQLVRNKIVPTFWEGVASASGRRSGSCFVELSRR